MTVRVSKIILITGGTSGIGLASAQRLAKNGNKVYAASRSADVKTTMHGAGEIKFVKVDVNQEESIALLIEQIIRQDGRIDVLINNAGFGIAGSIEDTTIEEASKQLNTNFFGTLRVTRAVLPHMRAAGQGKIINISSVAALIPIPYQAMYSVSKAAIDSMTQSLAIEVKPFGIQCCIIQPGDTKTDFTTGRIICKAAEKESSNYHQRFNKSLNRMVKDEMNGMSPEAIAKIIACAANRKHMPLRITPGISYKILVALYNLMPMPVTRKMIALMYG